MINTTNKIIINNISAYRYDYHRDMLFFLASSNHMLDAIN